MACRPGADAADLRHTWSDGTTQVVFEPLTSIEKLAALAPPDGSGPAE